MKKPIITEEDFTMQTIHRIAAGVAGAALSLGVLATPALADAPAKPAHVAKAPCAQQTAQVAKAEKALARVTAVFARQSAKVVKAKKVVKHADNASERGQARKALAKARAQKAHSLTVKKAQVERLAKAKQRLAACQAPAA